MSKRGLNDSMYAFIECLLLAESRQIKTLVCRSDNVILKDAPSRDGTSWEWSQLNHPERYGANNYN